MIDLLPFTRRDFEPLKSWIQSEEELIQFAGPIFNYPLDDEQLLRYVNRTDLKPFKVILTSTNETIGHCELNHQNGNNRLSRILLGRQDLRGKKIGEQMVRKMVDLIFEDTNVREVDLNVYDWNIGARKCYEKVGFKVNPEGTEEMIVLGKSWTQLNMVLKREI